MDFSEAWMVDFKHNFKIFGIDFIAGSIAGMAVTLSGHPFE